MTVYLAKHVKIYRVLVAENMDIFNVRNLLYNHYYYLFPNYNSSLIETVTMILLIKVTSSSLTSFRELFDHSETHEENINHFEKVLTCCRFIKLGEIVFMDELFFT